MPRKLGRTSKERNALLRNLASQLLWYGKIETTAEKAKELRSYAEKLITKAVNTYDDNIEYEVTKKDAKGKEVTVKNVKTDEEQHINIDGVFIAIGHKPNTDIFKEYLNLDATGYIKTNPDSTQTNIAGVFAAGDVKDPRFRQAITAAGSGAMAAMEATKYLSEI